MFRNQFDAQYGHALNAVVSVVTRSGTNRYGAAASISGVTRRSTREIRWPLRRPAFDEQRIGGSAGGPVVRDRSHFFAAYERDNVDTVRIIALPPTNPLAASENGLFPAETDNQNGQRPARPFGSRPTHAVSLRYAFDDQQIAPGRNRCHVRFESGRPGEPLSQRGVRGHADLTQNAANTFRAHLLTHTPGTVPRNADVGIVRPSGTIGQTNADSQMVPRTVVSVSDTLYLHTPRHDVKLGGEFAFATHDLDAHVFEHGVFDFPTDAPFDANNAGTWPIAFRQQKPTVVTYRSKEIGIFVQDDWRVAGRLRVNAGIRYDVDLNLRVNDFYDGLLEKPALAGLDQFVSRHRGTDRNNVQPRLGATWDVRATDTWSPAPGGGSTSHATGRGISSAR